MKKGKNGILPMPVTNIFQGKKVAMYTYILLVAISLVRSLIHFLSADGGAGTIAGFDLTAGRDNIVFVFALWGSSQLMMAFIQIAVAFRYRSLIPAMYLLLIIETLSRMFIGATRNSVIAGIPPGGYANYVMLPLCGLMFLLAMIPGKTTAQIEKPVE